MSDRTPDANHPASIEHVYQFDITARQKPERLDAFITHSIEHASRSRVQKAIDRGAVTVNGTPSKANYRVKPGDKIVITVVKPPPLQLIPEDIPVPVVYEDEHLIVFDKPAGMPVHPGFGNRTGTLVNAMLWHAGLREPLDVLKRREHWTDAEEDGAEESAEDQEDPEVDVADVDDDIVEVADVGELSGADEQSFFTSSAIRPGIVHRLDKDTSGLIVIGKTYQATMLLSRQFAARTVKREYIALAWGVIKDDFRIIEGDIGRSTRDRKLMTVVQRGGKYAATEVTVIERYDCATLIRCKLRTGRTHQIRVHLSHIKHPIVGDEEYGGRELAINSIHHLFRKEAVNALHAIHRQALHARTLGFIHPFTQQEMMFSSELPADITAAISVLRPADAPAFEL
jgi:23S rRNA pseudouridine1911/1915/1917 synthase